MICSNCGGTLTEGEKHIMAPVGSRKKCLILTNICETSDTHESRKCKCGYIDLYSRGHVYYDVEHRKHSWSECDPFSYSAARMDRLIENHYTAPTRLEYETTRSELWKEIQDAMEWSRQNGFVHAHMRIWGCNFDEAKRRLDESRTPDKKEA